MFISKVNAKERRIMDNLKAESEKQKVMTEYIAMMADVELPESEDSNGTTFGEI